MNETKLLEDIEFLKNEIKKIRQELTAFENGNSSLIMLSEVIRNSEIEKKSDIDWSAQTNPKGK